MPRNVTIRLAPLLLAGAGALQAAAIIPDCATLSTFAALQAAGSCAAGDFTIKGAAFQATGSNMTAADLAMSVSLTGGIVGVSLTSPLFVSGQGETSTFLIEYTVDPPPEIISIIRGEMDGADQDLFGLSLGPLALTDAVEGQFRYCVDVPFDGTACGGRSFGFVLTLPDTSQSFFSAAVLADQIDLGSDPTNVVGVTQLVTLRNGGRISGLSTGLTLTPEPGAAAMVAAGLAMLGLLRRRKRTGGA